MYHLEVRPDTRLMRTILSEDYIILPTVLIKLLERIIC